MRGTPIDHTPASSPFYSTRSSTPEKTDKPINPPPPNVDWLLVLVSVLLLITVLIAWSVGLLF